MGTFGPSRAQLRRLLQCNICQGLLHNAALLACCGHSFCSACIRRALSFGEATGVRRRRCPSCREPADASDVVANRRLQQLVEAFRPSLGLQVASALPPVVRGLEVFGVKRRDERLRAHLTLPERQAATTTGHRLQQLLRAAGFSAKQLRPHRDALYELYREFVVHYNSQLDNEAHRADVIDRPALVERVLQARAELLRAKKRPRGGGGGGGGGKQPDAVADAVRAHRRRMRRRRAERARALATGGASSSAAAGDAAGAPKDDGGRSPAHASQESKGASPQRQGDDCDVQVVGSTAPPQQQQQRFPLRVVEIEGELFEWDDRTQTGSFPPPCAMRAHLSPLTTHPPHACHLGHFIINRAGGEGEGEGEGGE